MNPSLKILAKIFNDKEFIELPEEYFLEDNFKKIYKAIQKYYINTDKVPTPSFFVKSIIPKIEKDTQKKDQLKSIVSNLPEDVEEDVGELQELAEESYKKVSLSRLSKELVEALKQDKPDEVDPILSKMQQVRESGTYDHLEEDNHNIGLQGIVKRVSTGFKSGDRNLATAPESSVILITGPAKHGKTTVALMGIINKFFDDHSNILIYSWEMTKAQLILRAISMLSDVPYEEVEVNKFSTEENRLKVKAVELAFRYDITPKESVELILNKGEESFESLKPRKNKIFIRAGLSTNEIRKAKKENKRIKQLPDYKTLFGEIREYDKAYGIDAFLLDYIQQIPIGNQDREKGITELIKEVKSTCVEISANAYVPAQSEIDSRIVKYARSLSMYCDIQIAIVRNKALDKFKNIGLGIAINRHGPWGYATLWENQLDRMRLEEISDDKHGLDELFENKE